MSTLIEQIKPKPKNMVSDLVAGLTNAVVNIPDSIAAAVLAGVNPTYAFNAIMVGTPVGALFTSSKLLYSSKQALKAAHAWLEGAATAGIDIK
ncbi:MAG: SulP family inorganic anion transporter [Chloroflexota bacterium]|nr:SulP family inorganic anion transporter [Chloroflexota bacterium]